MQRNAFSMIELVFVIVILGILASIAIPRLIATRDDADIAKGRSDIAAIRAAIVVERQGRLLKGESSYINKLHASDTLLFENNGTSASRLLQYGIPTQANKSGYWQPSPTQSGNNWLYKYHLMGSDQTFTYNPTDGTFKCTSGNYCDKLTK